jgi:hypothetical protein
MTLSQMAGGASSKAPRATKLLVCEHVSHVARLSCRSVLAHSAAS